MGAVLHTANPRLSDEQIAFPIAHAGSRILFFEPNLAELVPRPRPLLPGLERYALPADRAAPAPDIPDSLNYHASLARHARALTRQSLEQHPTDCLSSHPGTTEEPQRAR